MKTKLPALTAIALSAAAMLLDFPRAVVHAASDETSPTTRNATLDDKVGTPSPAAHTTNTLKTVSSSH